MTSMAKTPVGSNSASVDLEQAKFNSEEEVVAAAAEGHTQSDVTAISWKNWVNVGAYVVNTIVTYTSLTGIFGATNSELSRKYQTLVTPAGWAFSIWGPIFIWEGIFVVAQLFPRFRSTKVVSLMSPWWWSLCACQVAWTLAFAQDQVTLALVFMLSILASLLGISWSTDGLPLTSSEYFLLRAPLSLQLGWIIAASAVNASVAADAAQSSQEALLALAVVSNAAVLALVAVFTFAVRSPDAFVGMVAAWAFAAIRSELGNPVDLNDPTRFNPSAWGTVVLGGLQNAALIISVLSTILALIATASRVFWASPKCQTQTSS
mmetsp:Transcript_105233/g.181873  ORF Transcript_105233/g.181873 Transcript_105233/m.181873 type:complete len:320 (-) Transcript_105233:311-1270(-)